MHMHKGVQKYWLHAGWASDDKQTALPGQWASLIKYMHDSRHKVHFKGAKALVNLSLCIGFSVDSQSRMVSDQHLTF